MYRNTPTTHVLTEKLVVKILQPISSWRMEMDRLKAHVEQRVPPRSLDISDAVVGYAQQLEFARFVEPQIGSNPHYFKSVLSRYIEQIESCSEETSDEVYELLVDPVVLNSRELAPDVAEVVKYHVGGFSRADDCVMKVEETPRLISGVNTTGLRTWEAALFLANFINNRDDDGEMRALFKDKVVLELGCGTGLLGLSLAKYGLVRRMIMTDGSTAVFEHNRKLVELNGLDTSAAVSWQQLVWGDDAFCIKEKVDVVVVAQAFQRHVASEPPESTARSN
ncbi:uncharacterized protein LODBEIA_P45490 [Lodderomyces beijingensis]|uniref:FAM86 N-terminal domain-containing protein n=1 Tax=Lodderomyces beijingensis TaxID=1775926 RepID=A0ABP0ZSZ4_9ASCO